jgi:uncharacterized membrane protein YhaH (DUF805 family)
VNPALRRIAEKLGLMGRTKRTTLLLYFIVVGAARLAWSLAAFREARRGGLSPETLATLTIVLPWIDLGARLVFFWLAVRRFHDQDRPGWLALAPALILASDLLFPVPPLVALLVLVGFLVALLLPPTVGPNRYGPDPRGWRSPEHYAEERRLGRAT